MGIGYEDSIVLYNRILDGVMEKETYFGKRFDGVRIELNQGSRTATTGKESADACTVKIPMELAEGYLPMVKWIKLSESEKQNHFTLDKEDGSFFAIAKKRQLGIEEELPVGKIDSDTYTGGFRQNVSSLYGYAYSLNRVESYDLIPRFEIGGN